MQGSTLNDHFLNLMEQFAPGRVERGPIKRPDRAFQKVVRKYYRDPRCLTDIVRCSIVLLSIGELGACLDSIFHKSIIGDGAASNSEDEVRQLLVGMEEGGWTDKLFKVTKIKDRLTGDVKDGYRDICLNVEVLSFLWRHTFCGGIIGVIRARAKYIATQQVGWTISSELDEALEFVSPCNDNGVSIGWNRPGIRTHICEVM